MVDFFYATLVGVPLSLPFLFLVVSGKTAFAASSLADPSLLSGFLVWWVFSGRSDVVGRILPTAYL